MTIDDTGGLRMMEYDVLRRNTTEEDMDDEER